jgi:hypothetical protein
MLYNLIYNLCLIDTNPILYFNISNLKKYLHKFNHKKIINVNYRDYAFAKQFVETHFKDHPDIEFIFSDNELNNGWYELTPFITKLMPRVYSLNKNEFTFYGHSKGVTRYLSSTQKHSEESQSQDFICLLWAYTMYHKNLENFNDISNILQNYSCCGTLKLNKPYTALSFVPWHYSGSFFWLNNYKIFSKNWEMFYPNIYGIEAYPATHFNSSEAYSIKPELPLGYEDTYSKKSWEQFMEDII